MWNWACSMFLMRNVLTVNSLARNRLHRWPQKTTRFWISCITPILRVFGFSGRTVREAREFPEMTSLLLVWWLQLLTAAAWSRLCCTCTRATRRQASRLTCCARRIFSAAWQSRLMRANCWCSTTVRKSWFPCSELTILPICITITMFLLWKKCGIWA